MGTQERGFQTGEKLKKLNLHAVRYLLLNAARYCYYIQLVTPSDAATAVTIDNNI